jgi:hypothetical protein
MKSFILWHITPLSLPTIQATRRYIEFFVNTAMKTSNPTFLFAENADDKSDTKLRRQPLLVKWYRKFVFGD